ncbi:tautomerase family protein [Rhizobium sp. SL86]|uniref:tautomerase family protein n=1 Tax=Rhizobium sp. SL86 TaxID=2995148 RepID=UPI0022736E3A|nr:tautomerase family protein [Rhizobium sp. SL86]MCY1668858.1 tautomerase family protein [Rhizobium sp. SL86]
MPFIHIRLAGETDARQDYRRLQKDVTALIADVLNKRADLTSVLVDPVDVSRWSIGGEAIQAGAHLDAYITRGTNTDEEKQTFIAGAHALLERFCGGSLPLATYVVIHEIDAEAWGYGGRTQAARRGV